MKKRYAYDVNVVAVSWWNHYAGIPIKFAAEFGRNKVASFYSAYMCWAYLLELLHCIDCIAWKTTLHLPIALANGKSFFPPAPSIMFSILYSALFFYLGSFAVSLRLNWKAFNAKKFLRIRGKNWKRRTMHFGKWWKFWFDCAFCGCAVYAYILRIFGCSESVYSDLVFFWHCRLCFSRVLSFKWILDYFFFHF